MTKIKIILTILTIFYFSSLKAAETIIGNVEGMFCIECQKKLSKAFKKKQSIIYTIMKKIKLILAQFCKSHKFFGFIHHIATSAEKRGSFMQFIRLNFHDSSISV